MKVPGYNKPVPQPKRVLVQGQFVSMAEASRQQGLTAGVVSHRLSAGWTLEEALGLIARPVRNHTERGSNPRSALTVRGVTKTFKEWAAHCGLTHNQMRYQLRVNGRKNVATSIEEHLDGGCPFHPRSNRSSPKKRKSKVKEQKVCRLHLRRKRRKTETQLQAEIELTYDGRTQTLAAWAAELKRGLPGLIKRHTAGLSPEEVLYSFARGFAPGPRCSNHSRRAGHYLTDQEQYVCAKCATALKAEGRPVEVSPEQRKRNADRARERYYRLPLEQRKQIYRERADYLKEWNAANPLRRKEIMRAGVERRAQRLKTDPNYRAAYIARSAAYNAERYKTDPVYAAKCRAAGRRRHRRKRKQEQERAYQELMASLSPLERQFITEVFNPLMTETE